MESRIYDYNQLHIEYYVISNELSPDHFYYNTNLQKNFQLHKIILINFTFCRMLNLKLIFISISSRG